MGEEPGTGGGHGADRALLAGLAMGLDPIDLEAVSESADLQTRFDQKYLVPIDVLVRLVRALGPELTVLDIGGRRVFGYESVYFDTADLNFYRDHVQGRRIRHKVRTRLYTDSGLAMLEVKAKGRRGETVKHRMPWRPRDLHRIHEDGRRFIDVHVGGRPDADDLEPVLESCYHRMTLVHRSGDLRVTCDVDLAFAQRHAPGAVVPGGRVLVETKSRTGRSPADRLLHRYGHRDIEVSKYCAGLALTRGVAANRWQRTLRRYLTPDRGRGRTADAAPPDLGE